VTKDISKEIIALEDYALPILRDNNSIVDNLKAIFSAHDFLKSLKWKSIQITIDNQHFTLVPTTLFRKEYSLQYLQLAKGKNIEENEEVASFEHEALEITNIYSTERELYNWLSETYPFIDCTYRPASSQLIDFAITSSKAQTAFLSFGNGYFLITITVNGTLKFCNRFYYKTAQDLVYYVLFVLNETQIEPDEILLRLYGNVKEQSEDFELLLQYLPNVMLGDAINEQLFLEVIPSYRYVGLVSA
jgi:hypothetical protein